MAWAIIVLVLSTLSGAEVSRFPLVNIPNMDKVVHFSMYFVFTFLMMYDFARFKEKTFSWKQIIVFSLLAAIVYGGMMELLQSIPKIHRSCDIKDFMANSVGAIVAVLLYKPLDGLINRAMALIIKPKNPYSL